MLFIHGLTSQVFCDPAVGGWEGVFGPIMIVFLAAPDNPKC